jgi:hypothetical protein
MALEPMQLGGQVAAIPNFDGLVLSGRQDEAVLGRVDTRGVDLSLVLP